MARPAHVYTDADWDFIKDVWAKEVRRGAEPLYWEDVKVGDQPAWTVDGPIDESLAPTAPYGMGTGGSRTLRKEIMDPATFATMVRGEDGVYRLPEPRRLRAGRAGRRQALLHGRSRGRRDRTRAVDTQDIHKAGADRAALINFLGRDLAIRHINNWMGDHGWLQNIRWGIMPAEAHAALGKIVPKDPGCEYFLGKVPFMAGKHALAHGLTGDLALVKSYVYDKYVRSGEFFVDLAWWIETIEGDIWLEGGATVKLPSLPGAEVGGTVKALLYEGIRDGRHRRPAHAQSRARRSRGQDRAVRHLRHRPSHLLRGHAPAAVRPRARERGRHRRAGRRGRGLQGRRPRGGRPSRQLRPLLLLHSRPAEPLRGRLRQHQRPHPRRRHGRVHAGARRPADALSQSRTTSRSRTPSSPTPSPRRCGPSASPTSRWATTWWCPAPAPSGWRPSSVFKLAGARHVTALEIVPEKRALAAALGADLVLDPVAEGDGLKDRIAAVYGGLGPDIVAECAGKAQSLGLCIDLVRNGGQVLNIGAGGEPLPIVPAMLAVREVGLKSSLAYGAQEAKLTLDYLAAGRFKTGGMLSDVIPLDDIVDKGFKRLVADRSLVKVAVKP